MFPWLEKLPVLSDSEQPPPPPPPHGHVTWTESWTEAKRPASQIHRVPAIAAGAYTLQYIYIYIFKYLEAKSQEASLTNTQFFHCISLKLLVTGILQIFANSCKFASQLCQIKKMPFHFLVKWVYHMLYIFQFQIFDKNWPSLLYIQYIIHTVESAGSRKSGNCTDTM